ncbi:MAG: nucleoside-diphosphate sugar epimerase/dehydratase [Candidatus Krumholzibacteria bacterium]|nr:nucleoside-diphosphate sugar epimerase/dehydratase [Candidatus Krumholzibacteria bacterium]
MVEQLRKTLGALKPPSSGPLSLLVRRHRLLFFVLFFGSIAALSVAISFWIRFEVSWLVKVPNWSNWLRSMLLVAVPVRLIVFYAFGLHRVSWRFAGLRDVPPLVYATLVGSAFDAAILLWAYQGAFPRSVLIIDTVICLTLATVGRYAYRILDHVSRQVSPGPRVRVVIVGAGRACNLVLEAMNSPRLNTYKPVAIMDDDRLKQGITIHGVTVYTPIDSISEVARKHGAEAIILAVPSAATAQLYRIVKLCRETGLPLKTTPDIWQILQSSEAVTRIQDFSLDDLLNRRVVRSDVPEIHRLLAGRTVLVTGAAGSIGSELCRQVLDQRAARLICLDKDENGLFRLEQELRRNHPGADCCLFLGDIKDSVRLRELFAERRPQIVFHAAAYKHVPILQFHPVEAVRNNVGGTLNVARLAQEHGVERFVMISTDKAVRPTSVMGATKQVAEKVIRELGVAQPRGTRFLTIRFGNVLGSAGSVVELFLKQIRQGGPVTVTDPRIERFFMTIAEAVHLVLFAASMGEGDEIFILDMGEPVKIDHLARQMIQLAGLVPEVDVPIAYTGLRPGEKLYEELWTDEEQPEPTVNPGIRVARRRSGMTAAAGIASDLELLLQAADRNDTQDCWRHLLRLVPDFAGRTGHDAEIPPEAPASAPPPVS